MAELVAEGHLALRVAVRLLELDCRANGLWDNIGALRNDGPERCRATIVSAFSGVELDREHAPLSAATKRRNLA
jgi:hypothetical protein